MLDAAIRIAGLESMLERGKPTTLFAPSDQAFYWLRQRTTKDVFKNAAMLRELLEYHIVPLKLTRASLLDLISGALDAHCSVSLEDVRESGQCIGLPTLSNHILLARYSDQLSVQNVVLLEPELEVDNAVVHPIAQVLLPPQFLLAIRKQSVLPNGEVEKWKEQSHQSRKR